MNVIDKNQLVSWEETAMIVRHTPRHQRADDDHGASNIERVLQRAMQTTANTQTHTHKKNIRPEESKCELHVTT